MNVVNITKLKEEMRAAGYEMSDAAHLTGVEQHHWKDYAFRFLNIARSKAMYALAYPGKELHHLIDGLEGKTPVAAPIEPVAPTAESQAAPAADTTTPAETQPATGGDTSFSIGDENAEPAASAVAEPVVEQAPEQEAPAVEEPAPEQATEQSEPAVEEASQDHQEDPANTAEESKE